MSCQKTPGWISLLLLVKEIYNFHEPNFLCQIHWTMNSGRQDIENIHIHFPYSTKNGHKVGVIYKTEPFPELQFCKFPKLFIHFL